MRALVTTLRIVILEYGFIPSSACIIAHQCGGCPGYSRRTIKTSLCCPILVSIKILGYKKVGYALIRLAAIADDTAMSSQTNNTITDELQLAFNTVLLQIVHNLEKEEQEELRFYYNGIINKGEPGPLSIPRSLENAGKISWKDVRFLMKGLRGVRRLDLAEILTEYEIKRDLTVLLYFYATKRQGSEVNYRSAFESVENVARYLLNMTEIVPDQFDVSNAVRSLMGSTKGIQQVLVDFEEEGERELSDPWSKLTLLVVISGEIIAVALANEGQCWKPEVLTELLFTLADQLCFRMFKLGSWVS